MTNCKFCGMESKKPDKCEWCGRSLIEPAKPPDLVPTTVQRIQEEDEVTRRLRPFFYIGCSVLLIIAAIIMWINKGCYPFVIIGGLFISGILMGCFRVIPSFENDWMEVGLPTLFIVFAPAFFVCLGYIAYTLIYRSIDFTIIWLLGVYVAMVTALMIVILIGVGGKAPPFFFLKIRGSEILGWAAIVFGWIASGSIRPASR